MGNMMIGLDEEYEELLRRLAQEKYGGKKGSLTEVVQDALDKMKEDDREKSIEELTKRLKTGLSFKYKMYKNRNEIYDD